MSGITAKPARAVNALVDCPPGHIGCAAIVRNIADNFIRLS
jgi:hypothetical protein